MKDFFKEIFELFANCVCILTLILASYLLLSNIYHYFDISEKYVYDINLNETYKNFKESVSKIENSINSVNVDRITNQNKKMVASIYKAKTSQCIDVIKKSEFYNIEKTEFSVVDVYNYNKELNKTVQPYCLFLLQAELNDAVEKYKFSSNKFDYINKNLLKTREEIATDSGRLENRLLSNSSYSWTTDTLKNTIYNFTSDTFFTNLTNYSRLINAVEESSSWFVEEFGGNL